MILTKEQIKALSRIEPVIEGEVKINPVTGRLAPPGTYRVRYRLDPAYSSFRGVARVWLSPDGKTRRDDS